MIDDGVAVSAEKILAELRQLPATDRLRVVEQVVREVATEVAAGPSASSAPIWADESDTDFDAFQSAIERSRAADVWRASDESDAP
jgi:hypothetical protein